MNVRWKQIAEKLARDEVAAISHRHLSCVLFASMAR
jgi:hypothetical protein